MTSFASQVAFKVKYPVWIRCEVTTFAFHAECIMNFKTVKILSAEISEFRLSIVNFSEQSIPGWKWFSIRECWEFSWNAASLYINKAWEAKNKYQENKKVEISNFNLLCMELFLNFGLHNDAGWDSVLNKRSLNWSQNF